MVKVWISPRFEGEDKADGGIRRVVDAQRAWLPKYGADVVPTPDEADVLALHAGLWPDGRIRPEQVVVAHCHGLYWEGYEWARWAMNLNGDVIRTLRQSDAITAPSKWVAHAIERGTWVKPTVLYHGINPDEWRRGSVSSELGPYVLWNKTRVDAVCAPEAVNLLAARARDVQFVSTFGERASNVSITGAQGYAQGKEFVRNAAVYLCTARETFGIGTLEAMACEVPVLGWRWGGQAEFVEHGKTGYLAKPGDFDDLLEGLRFCLDNEAMLGKAARAYVLKNFTWEQRIKPYADLYKQLYEREHGRPSVSVIITNYNLGRYLEEAVRSVETSKEVELVVVDDASTEPLPASVEEAAAEGSLKLVRNDKNQYLAEALNTGIAASSGRYIVPLDADNWLAPRALDALRGALDADRSLDIAYGKMRVHGGGEEASSATSTFVSDWPPFEAQLKDQLSHRNQVSSTAMYRRRVWERVGGYRSRCHTAEDADFWCRALATGARGRRVTDAVVLEYRDRDDSMSHVQKDWAWHKWYRWAGSHEAASFTVGGPIYTCEFPTVSVVLPVGPGHARRVLDALDSIQNQTYVQWEAVVVNDTGLPLPWVHAWARVFDADKRTRGVSNARNIGIERARGKYVLFLDADDFLHPDAIMQMVRALDNAGPNHFVYSDWYKAESGEVQASVDFDPNEVLRELPFPVTCMYYKSDLDKHRVRFDPAFKKGWEDWDFALQVVAKAGICGLHVQAPLFHYRMSTGTLRGQAYEAREELKKDIYAKWADYVDGKEKNMGACGGCGGGGFAPTVYNYGDPANEPQYETELLEYISDETGSRSYLGPVTGNRYRFSTDEDRRERQVRVEDVPHLLSLGVFRRKTGSFEPLQASGAPK